jgi:hypothetical protein
MWAAESGLVTASVWNSARVLDSASVCSLGNLLSQKRRLVDTRESDLDRRHNHSISFETIYKVLTSAL